MALEGFDYVAFVPDGAPLVARSNEGLLSEREWVSRYGYGLSLRPETRDAPDIDPNFAILESLPQAEREKYSIALLGAELGLYGVSRIRDIHEVPLLE